MDYEDFTTAVSSRRAFESALNFALAVGVALLVILISAVIS